MFFRLNSTQPHFKLLFLFCSAYSVRNIVMKNASIVLIHFCGKSQFRGYAQLRLLVKKNMCRNCSNRSPFAYFESINNPFFGIEPMIDIVDGNSFVNSVDCLKHFMEEQSAEGIPEGCNAFYHFEILQTGTQLAHNLIA